MKILVPVILLASTVLSACHSDKTIELSSDSTKYDSVAVDSLIVPGQSVGKFRLGQDIAEVNTELGKPAFSDAAMGKAWEIWYEGDTTKSKKDEIAIYSAYGDSTMKTKVVKQIRVTSEKYSTKDQLSTGNSRFDFRVKFPDSKKIATYFNSKLGDTLKVVDSKSAGIAVEYIRGIGRAITIHKKGEELITTYLTLSSDYKPVQ